MGKGSEPSPSPKPTKAETSKLAGEDDQKASPPSEAIKKAGSLSPRQKKDRNVLNYSDPRDNDLPMNAQEIMELLCTPSENSVMVSSNLRRAIPTAVIAFWKRFTTRGCNEKLY